MKSWRFYIVLAAVLALAACAPTIGVHQVKTSGFLGADAAKLKPGGPDGPALIYMNPKANWPAYSKMLLDPVTFWRAPGKKDQGVSHADLQKLINYFHLVIYQQMSKDVKMVNAPGPHTLRVKVALTKAEKSIPALDIVSTVVPQMAAVSTAKLALTGKPAFVGAARIAFKVTDSVSGELLAAAVAERVGGKELDAAHLDSWGDVKEAMQFWAVHAAYRLCKLQKKTDCKKPKDD